MIVALALLARLTTGAEVCGRVTDCVIDVGRACARKHLPRRLERAAAAKIVAVHNSQDVDSDGCYTEKWMIQHIRDYVSTTVEEIPMMKELGELPAAMAHQVISYLECVVTSEAAEDMSRHGYSCDDVCENMVPTDIYKDYSTEEEIEILRLHCSLRLGCLARNEAYYYDLSADEATAIECVDLSVDACAEATLAAAELRGTEPVIIGPLRNATVGDECRAAFARDELSEDDVFSERELYTGEARETAWKIMQNVHSKEARRFKRLQDEELSRMKARGEL
ncbi:unnamed protein product [Pelagomonas calceolata]|uniref:Uncharacterized protein n=1 Tax=Pelagomonas calceolata TaxID=35677 RepID=A0A8J2WTI8_9STRA|nr:unnamed protein product [Pelagomonas calceolata]